PLYHSPPTPSAPTRQHPQYHSNSLSHFLIYTTYVLIHSSPHCCSNCFHYIRKTEYLFSEMYLFSKKTLLHATLQNRLSSPSVLFPLTNGFVMTWRSVTVLFCSSF